MPLSAIHEKNITRNVVKSPTGATVSKNVSPASGVVPSANTGDSSAGGYVTASVLGTGMNTDRLTNTREAV